MLNPLIVSELVLEPDYSSPEERQGNSWWHATSFQGS